MSFGRAHVVLRVAAVVAVALCVRCTGCLPPLLSDTSDIVPLPAPDVLPEPDIPDPTVDGPATLPVTTCTGDPDCSGPADKCCPVPNGDSVCGRCCQNSDCNAVMGVALVCDEVERVCVPCARTSGSTATCDTGEVCCAPGTGGNASSTNTCAVGACCNNADCAGNVSGTVCVANRCTLGACTGEGLVCQGSGLCCGGVCLKGATCCSQSDCSNGQVCSDGACTACDATHPCAIGDVCCGGACVAGNCCASDDCANTALACVNHVCGTCTVGGSDCRTSQSCCDAPTAGPTCIAGTECCPSVTNNLACDGGSNPKQRACSFASRACGSCDPTTAPCATGKTCCGGGCVTPGGPPRVLDAECCAGADCASNACDPATNRCVECLTPGTCGTPTGALGTEVCDVPSRACVACDATHSCGGGQLCCGGLCFAGTCCGASDCTLAAPVCDVATHSCRNCALDSDCGSGRVCVASGGVGVCPGPGQNCQCQSGNCHETDAQVAADCAGACCTYVCTAGGDCCDNADCSAANYGYNPTSQCVSAQNAVAVQVCTAARLCGCPAPGPDTYVDGTIGSDTIGNGSAACPLRTITRALAIRGGTIINVRPGRYELGETFPLDPPANTTLQRDPTCAAGAAIIARTDSATTCPVQRGSGPAVSCAITVRQAGVQVHGLNIKNLHGRAIAFGSGANATSGVDSGVVGCESSVANACGRGGSEQRQDLEPIFVGGAASPVIGPAAGNALTLGGSLGSAIVIADSAQPSVRNIDGFTGYDDDVIRVVDAATPALTNLRINWPAGPITANTKRCVQVSGTGGATTLSSVWMAGCGTGGVIVTRAPNSAVPHTFTDVRVETSAGTPQGFGTDLNRREGFGLWLTATQGVSPVVVTGGRFANNRGHGVVVQDASLTMNGAVVEANGQQTASGTNCFGGNGLDLISAQAIAIVDASTFQGTRGRTSPPPAAPAACATGNGVHTQGGQLTLRGSRLTNNQFDGLLVDQGTQAAIVENNLFMSNTANGIETQIVNTQLGACTGATCVGGNNRFRECPTTPGGNNRANLCFVTTALVFVPPVLNAENNRWLNAPPDVSGDDNPPPPIPSAPRDVIIYNPFANGTLHCGGLGTHDVIIVSSPSSFFGLGPSVVNLNPTQTPLTCP